MGDNFSTADNWNPNSAPSNGDDLVFPAGMTDDPNADLALSDVTIESQNTGDVQVNNSGGLVTTLRPGAAAVQVLGAGDLTLQNPLALAGDSTFTVSDGGGALFLLGINSLNGHTLTVDTDDSVATIGGGLLGPGGGLVKQGNGHLLFNNSASTYTGPTTVSGGHFWVQVTDAIPDSSPVSVAAGSSMWFQQNERIASLSGAGTVKIDKLFIVGEDNTSTVFSGVVEGDGDLIKKGAGTLTLSGANTHTGDTYVDDGVMLVNGTMTSSYYDLDAEDAGTSATLRLGGANRLPDTSNVCLISSGTVFDLNGFTQTVGGVGCLGTVTTGGATLYVNTIFVPGDMGSTGIFKVGNTYLKPGSSFHQEMIGATPGTHYDQTQVTGTLTLDNPVLDMYFHFLYTPAQGTSFTIITNDGADPVNGTFSQGDFATADGMSFHISYTGGDGNDVVVTRVASTPTADPATSVGSGGFTANWNASDGAASYRLDVATDSGFNSLVSGYSDKNVGNVTSHQVTGLTSGTNYYYRVRAHNGTLSGGDSNTISVTTTGVAPGPPAPTALEATDITNTTFKANWTASAGAASYRLDVATDSGFTSMVTGYSDLNTGDVTTYEVAGLAAGTTYYYRVRGHDGVSPGGNSNTISVTTTGTSLAPKAPLALAASNVTKSTFTANWSAASGADSYELQVACNAEFTDFNWGGFDARGVGNTTSRQVSGLRADWTYLYRVRAKNANGLSPWSNAVYVRTAKDSGGGGGGGGLQPPDLPKGFSTSPGNDPDKVSLNWGADATAQAVSSTGVYYRVYRALSPLGDKTLLGQTDATSWDDLTAEPGVRYYYWVTQADSSGEGEFGNYMTGWRYERNPGRVGDFNGDGLSDIFWWCDSTGEVVIWYSEPDGGRKRLSFGPAGQEEGSLIKGIGDIDGDGISDVIWWDPSGGAMQAWLIKAAADEGGGLGGLIKERLSLGLHARKNDSLCLGDIDGDGRDDILWRSLDSGGLSYQLTADFGASAESLFATGVHMPWNIQPGLDIWSWSDYGILPFPNSHLSQVTLDWEIAGMADFNGDGRRDIMWQNPLTGPLVVWHVNGGQVIGCDALNGLEHVNWRVPFMGRFNPRQSEDLLWRSHQNWSLRCWSLDGCLTYEHDANATMQGDLWRIKGLGDFDGNGKADIYWRHQQTGEVRIWLMDGVEVIGELLPGVAEQ